MLGPGPGWRAGPARGRGLTCPHFPSSSCFNGGTCLDGVNSFSCLCLPGYTGAHCQHQADPCLSRPCLHGGVCTATYPGFSCACPEGFTGTNCQVGGSLGVGLGGGVWRGVLGEGPAADPGRASQTADAVAFPSRHW